jgi:membrane fusion protein, multidrug efflux system
VEQPNLVDTMTLKRTTFQRELVTNGKLRSLNKSDLTFGTGGKLQTLQVKNGDLVQAGQTIGTLDQFAARQAVEQAEINLKKQKLNFEDELIVRSKGNGKRDTSSVEYRNAFLTSGYQDALKVLEGAKNDLQNTVLKAPFRGKVANLTARVHEQVGSGKAFCTIIDDSKFEVEFYLIESEISEVNMGDGIKITPFSQQKEYSGYVSEINPVVNASGQVMVKGIITNTGSLWEGMNVKVLIRKNIPAQLVVPKSSVVLRQDQYVLFTFKEGKALWTYINIVAENSSSYSVIADPEKDVTLEKGDVVITSGNLNLAHESDVKIRE